MPSKLPSILIRLTKTEKRQAIQAAKKDGRSVSAWARQLVRAAIDKGD